MPTPTETSYAPPPSGGTGPPFRILRVQVSIDGVPTLVDVEGVMLVDGDGRVIWKVQDDVWQQAVLNELRALNGKLAALVGVGWGADIPAGLGG